MAIAGTTTQQSGQAHLATVYYNRTPLDLLVPKFRFYMAGAKFPQPQGVGKTMQMWRDTSPTYNTNPAAEGVALTTPFVNPTSTVSVTVEAYSDFMSTSTMIEDTSIANELDRMVRALSIRAAYSVDTIIRGEVDGNTTTTVTISTISGTTATVNDIKKGVKTMEGLNVEPFEGNRWLCIAHPYAVYDLISDTTAGGFIEALKYQSGQTVLQGEIGEVGGARLLTTTNVNTSDSSTTTKYHMYLFGYQGLGLTELDGRQPSEISDPKRQNFKLDVYKGGGPWDPTHEIGSVVGYRFVFAAKTLDSQRFLIIKADPSMV